MIDCAGCAATDNFDSNIVLSANISISGTVNTSAPAGTKFTLVYTVTDSSGNSAVPATRIVQTVDTTPPVITVNGASVIVLEYQSDYVDAGAAAVDALNGVVAVSTVNPVMFSSPPASYLVVYTAVDPSGNAASAYRTVAVQDTQPPVISLLGGTSVTVEAGSSQAFVDPGVIATDALDGNCAVIVTGAVDMFPETVPATFTLSYTAVDRAGNAALAVTRVVTVVDTTKPLLTIVGLQNNTASAFAVYNDPGCLAFDALDLNITYRVTFSITQITPQASGAPLRQSTGYVNANISSQVTFEITYYVTDRAGNVATPITRTVSIANSVPPVVNIYGATTGTIEGACPAVGYVLTNVSASDPLDGDVSSRIIVSVATTGGVQLGGLSAINTCAALGTTYVLNITASDVSQNYAVPQFRTLTVVDTLPPVIALKAYTYTDNRFATWSLPLDNSIVILYPGEQYVEYGANVTDQYITAGTLLRSRLAISSINTTGLVAGSTLTVTYTASDLAGNQAVPVTRTVAIRNAPSSASSTAAVSGAGAGVGVLVVLILVLVVVLLVRLSNRSQEAQQVPRPPAEVQESDYHMYSSIYEQRVRTQEALNKMQQDHHANDDAPPVYPGYVNAAAGRAAMQRPIIVLDNSQLPMYQDIDTDNSQSDYLVPTPLNTIRAHHSSAASPTMQNPYMLESESSDADPEYDTMITTAAVSSAVGVLAETSAPSAVKQPSEYQSQPNHDAASSLDPIYAAKEEPIALPAPSVVTVKPQRFRQAEFFHGSIDRQEAQLRLMHEAFEGKFLVRARSEAADSYAFSYIRDGQVAHRIVEKGSTANVFVLDRVTDIAAATLEEAVQQLCESVCEAQGLSTMLPLAPPAAPVVKAGLFTYIGLAPELPELGEPPYMHGDIDRTV